MELESQENETILNPVEATFGFKPVSVGQAQSKNLASKSSTSSITADAASILISINDSNGIPVYENHKINLVRVGDDILSLPLSFTATGTYSISLFQVLDANDVALAMTPKDNSLLSSLVTTTLDYNFSIAIESTNRIDLDVIVIDTTLEAADFGYSTFSFEAIELSPFLLSVFAYADATSNFELTAATVTITHQNTSRVIHNQSHPASTTLIYIPTYEDEDYVFIEIGKSGYETYTASYTFGELRNHFDPVPQGAGPMIVTLNKNTNTIVSNGLLLHLDAARANSVATSQTWQDLSGNNLDFALKGLVTLEEDNGGRWNFNGGYFERPDGYGDFNLNEFTIEAWHYPIKYGSGSAPNIWSYDHHSHVSPYYVQNLKLSYDQNHSIGSSYIVGSGSSSINGDNVLYGGWNHHIVTYDGNSGKIYYNGNLLVENDAPSPQLAYQNQEVWIGSAYGYGQGYRDFSGNFKGYISIIRFYSKALNEEEVKQNFDAQKERFNF